MVRLFSPKNAYTSPGVGEAGELHLKTMGDDGLILMVCGVTIAEDESVAAPLADLDVGASLCPICFGPLTSGVGEPIGEKGIFTIPVSGLRFQEGEEFHVKFLSDGDHDVMACGLTGLSSGEVETPLKHIPRSKLCAGCFGPFELEGNSTSDGVEQPLTPDEKIENFEKIIDEFLETGAVRSISVMEPRNAVDIPQHAPETPAQDFNNSVAIPDEKNSRRAIKYALAVVIFILLTGAGYLFWGGDQFTTEHPAAEDSKREVSTTSSGGGEKTLSRRGGAALTEGPENSGEPTGMDEKIPQTDQVATIPKEAKYASEKEATTAEKQEQVSKEIAASDDRNTVGVVSPNNPSQINYKGTSSSPEEVETEKSIENHTDEAVTIAEKTTASKGEAALEQPAVAATPPPEDGEISFDDVRLEECVGSALAASAEGEISYDAFLALDSLDCSGLGITSANGIEYFSGLIKVDLSDNLISDVSPLLALPKLEQLDLSGNKNLASLPDAGFPSGVSVDLSGTPVGE